jgi:hypothetical protein
MSINPGVARGQTGSAAINAALDDAVRADSYTVATLPPAAEHNGKIIYCSNGALNTPCLAYSNGVNWLRIVFGQPVSTTV